MDTRTTHATGRAEREAAEAMIQAVARGRRATLGADKAHDAAEHIARLRAIGVTPHVAQHTSGRRKTRHRGLPRVGWVVTLTAAACNLVRLPKILARAA